MPKRLNNCRYCGAKEDCVRMMKDVGQGRYLVICFGCGHKTGLFDTADEAVEDWNGRERE